KKGFKLLINAISKLDQRFSLTIVGDGPQKEELRSLVNELKLENKVSFTGSLDRISVLNKLTESDIFVSASKIETFGIAILEALAVGLPVVTYDNGGVRDFMTDSCGIIVNEYTTEAFVKAINDLVNNLDNYDPLKIKNYVINSFSSKTFSQRVDEIYDKVLKEVER
ncbi:MAG: glycosyltransferase, partial [Athalassotoga sp.]